ncbi:MAG: prolipoprotein diacylglyceryl transferase [Dehalococcoidales bacterium]|jgi:phosphatidylglycerol:prolipoprotein diacylglycerol transferase
MIYIDVNPIAFSIGPVNIAWYGIMVMLSVLTVVTWALFSVKKDPRLSFQMVLNAALVGIPSGVIFSRFLHVLDFWDYYMKNPGKIIGGEGMSIWGAVLGAAIGIWLYSLFSKKFSFSHLADVIAPGIILAQAVGRVGCTLNGCCYGKITSLPWAIVYTNPGTHAPIGVPVHPTQVYEIIFDLIVFGVLLMLRKRIKTEGSLFLIYLSTYAVWRLAVDFIRDGTSFLFGLHQAQVVSIIVLVITTTLLIVRARRPNAGS